MANKKTQSSKTGGVDNWDEDDDDVPEEKPLIYKKPEPKSKFYKDDWGFPILPQEDVEPTDSDKDAYSKPS